MVEFIGAADIYITPYRQEAQVVSGTLAYAIGHIRSIAFSMREQPYSRTAQLCCFVAWRIDAVCRIFALRAPETESMIGGSIASRH